MPIRSPRGRAAAYRALWQWPLRSPARLAVLGAVVVALGVGVSMVTAVGGGPDGTTVAGRASVPDPMARAGPRTANPATPAPAGAATATALPPVPALEPSTLPLAQAPAASLDVAARWATAWLRPPDGTSTQQWLDGLRPTTTEEYLGVLGAVDPANIPSTKVTGQARPVRVAARSVQVEVPTDALTLVVLVVDTDAGWRVAGYDRA